MGINKFFVFSGRNAQSYLNITEAALHRLEYSLASGTQANYGAQLQLFVLYCMKLDIDIEQLHFKHIIGFIEMLARDNLSYATIVNYLSGIKTMLKKLNVNVSPFEHVIIADMLKACQRTILTRHKSKYVFTSELMHQLVITCRVLQHPVVYRAIFLMAFHGFFRISNLVPTSPYSFLLQKHLARGDVFFSHSGAQVLLKWSKTLQTATNTKVINLPLIPSSPLCPVTSLQTYIQAHPSNKNLPFFTISSNPPKIITQRLVRQALAKVLQAMGLEPAAYGFHVFRRSGATLAFNLNVPLQDIQAHGTWASQAVWAYLSTATNSAVSTAFKHHFTTT